MARRIPVSNTPTGPTGIVRLRITFLPHFRTQSESFVQRPRVIIWLAGDFALQGDRSGLCTIIMATDRDSISPSKQDREKRLAEALRANLRRRKAAGKACRAGSESPGTRQSGQDETADRGE